MHTDTLLLLQYIMKTGYYSFVVKTTIINSTHSVDWKQDSNAHAYTIYANI